MRVSSVFEAVNIVFNRFWVNSFLDGSLSKNHRLMNSLGPAEDFLSSHKEIVRAGEVRIILTNSGIERSCLNWISVEHIEVSIVFLFDWNKI